MQSISCFLSVSAVLFKKMKSRFPFFVQTSRNSCLLLFRSQLRCACWRYWFLWGSVWLLSKLKVILMKSSTIPLMISLRKNLSLRMNLPKLQKNLRSTKSQRNRTPANSSDRESRFPSAFLLISTAGSLEFATVSEFVAKVSAMSVLLTEFDIRFHG